MISDEQLEREIQHYIGPMFQSLEAASIQYFLEKGTINGSFMARLKELVRYFEPEYQKRDVAEAMQKLMGESPLRRMIAIQPDVRFRSGTQKIEIPDEGLPPTFDITMKGIYPNPLTYADKIVLKDGQIYDIEEQFQMYEDGDDFVKNRVTATLTYRLKNGRKFTEQ